MDNFLHLLVGTYTKGSSKGIYVYRFDTLTGDSEYISVAEAENPSFLASGSNGNYIYAVSENGDDPSFANAFSFDRSVGELKLINREPTEGEGACNIVVDNAGKHVLTANYGGGSITVFEVNSDGGISPASQIIEFEGRGADRERQREPHLHCVRFSPDNRFIFATDLGTDKIYRFDINNSDDGQFIKEETLKTFKVADGSGPRHFVFHPCGKFMYVINELAGTVVVFACDNGELREVQTVQADMLKARGSGDIGICPKGNFLYASNRLKGDGIAIFSVDHLTGQLTKVGYQTTGIHPRNFIITPNGRYMLVANKDSHNIEVYEIEQTSGLLTNINKDIKINMPVCLLLI